MASRKHKSQRRLQQNPPSTGEAGVSSAKESQPSSAASEPTEQPGRGNRPQSGTESAADSRIESVPSAIAGSAQKAAQPSLPPDQIERKQLRQRRWFQFAAAIAVAWWVVLVAMVLFSANPITVNREQILDSHYVVTGKLSDAGNSIVVEREWKRDAKLEIVSVEHLDRTEVKAGKSFIVPLRIVRRGEYQVTPSRLPNHAPLVYPATEEAMGQLKKILEER